MILKKPIDTGEKVDSNRAFKNLWLNWRVVGINPTRTKLALYISYSIFINLLFSILLPLSMFANIYYIKNIQLVVANLSLTFSFIVSTFKQMTLLYFRSTLKAVSKYLQPLDERCSKHASDRLHILHAIHVSNKFYAFFMFYYNFTVLGFAVIAMRNHEPIYKAWIPQLFKNAEITYWLAFCFHLFGQTFAVFQNGNNDAYPMCYLVMMIDHMRALAGRLERIGTSPRYTAEDNYQELLACIQDHKNILRYFDCIRPPISATLFLQFLITGFILCLTGINFLAFSQDTSQLLSNATYLFAVLMESFPCCYYVNMLCTESDYLTTAVYKSNWHEQDLKFRKTMIIFMQRTQLVNIIMAGGISPITLQTFVSILKFSFSMYTILSQIKID